MMGSNARPGRGREAGQGADRDLRPAEIRIAPACGEARAARSRRAALLKAASAGAVCAALYGVPAPAFAQSAPRAEPARGAQLEEIVVTARKREESLNDVPLSVSALSSAQLAARDISNINDVSLFTPSFHFQNQSGGGSGRSDRTINTLTFRGLVLGNDSGVRAGGLLFVDGAPVVSGTAPGLSDIERVEVLKGPQSAFFGRSTFSGAVNLVTADPPSELSARVSGAVQSYGSRTAQLMVGGPLLGDTLRARMSLYTDVIGGQWKNSGMPGEKLGRRRTSSVGVQVLWTPVESVRVKGAVTAFENEDGPAAQVALKQGEMNCNLNPATIPQADISRTPAPGNPQVANPNARNRYYCGEIPSADDLPGYVISANDRLDPVTRSVIYDNIAGFPTYFSPGFLKHPGLRRRAVQGSLKIDYSLPGDFTISSVTSGHSERVQTVWDLGFRDASATPNPFYVSGSTRSIPSTNWLFLYQTKNSDFSQELRLTSPQSSRFRWLLGGNYIEAEQWEGVIYGESPFGPIYAGIPSHFYPKTPAVFGAAYFDVLPELTASAELRYQVDKVRQEALGSSGGVLFAEPVKFAKDFRSLSPRLTLDWKPRPGTIVYGLWSRGYRPGGFNTTLSPQLGASQALLASAAGGGYSLSYDQEQLDNYEVGFKSRLLDGRAQLNVSLYRENYTKGQIGQLVTYIGPAGNPTQANLVRNVGEISLKGIEAEGEWQATEALQVSASFALNDSKIKSGFCTDCIGIYSAPKGTGLTPLNNDLAGKRLPIAPRVSATLGAEYTRSLAGGFEGFGRADLAYTGKRYVDQANVAYIGARNILNLRVGARSEKLTVEAFCSNCLDDLTAESATYAQTDALTLARPPAAQEIRYALPQRRMFGVRASYAF